MKAAPYKSQTVTNNAAMIGPMMKPNGPNISKPPSVANKINKSGNFVSLPTSQGRKKLSTEPTTPAHQATSPRLAPSCPFKAK
ncbi:hypothetical protein D3C83_67840 [compost metagenome]